MILSKKILQYSMGTRSIMILDFIRPISAGGLRGINISPFLYTYYTADLSMTETIIVEI